MHQQPCMLAPTHSACSLPHTHSHATAAAQLQNFLRWQHPAAAAPLMLHASFGTFTARSGAALQRAARVVGVGPRVSATLRGKQPSATGASSRADTADDALLAELVQAAAHEPVVALPPPQHATAPARGSGGSSHAHHQPQQQQQPQQQRIPLPGRKLRPSRMDFAAMLQRLAAWRACHLSAHVPRHCFDAPELGAWVRYMRKQGKEGRLEQWKADRLDALGFEWSLTDQDARWHHLYHQLRRHQLLYGSTDVLGTRSADHCDWIPVARWLRKQARLLAKRKLSSQKRDMLAQLGVTLRLPKRLVHRHAQLQGLNGPERRMLRKRWKRLDAADADARWQQQQRDAAARAQAAAAQQQVLERRQALLMAAGMDAAAAAAAVSALAAGDGLRAATQGQQQEGVSREAVTSSGSSSSAEEQKGAAAAAAAAVAVQQQAVLFRRNWHGSRRHKLSRQEQRLAAGAAGVD